MWPSQRRASIGLESWQGKAQARRRDRRGIRPIVTLLEDRTLLSFDVGQDYPTGSGPDSVAVGDFNGDGKLDLVTANHTAAAERAAGQRRRHFPAQGRSTPPARAPVRVAVGDFNGDGKLDLVTANAIGNNVSVLLGNGDGTFRRGELTPPVTSPVSWRWATSTATASSTW